MMNFNSFDVFDTLVGRRTINNDAVLIALEKSSGVEGFALKRKEADTGTRSLQQIYEALFKDGVIKLEDVERLMKEEIDLEISLSFPITKNIERVKDGDILISDMYLPASAILAIVRACGLDKQVTIYQSNSGKSSGKVWQKIKPNKHLGDNIHSDVNMPRKAGIDAEHFDNPQTLLMSCVNLLGREIQFRNHHINYFSQLSARVNVPFLLCVSEYLHKNVGHRNIVFLGRDCYLLHKIYTAYYGTAYYVPFSRKLAYEDGKKAIQYLDAHSPSNPLFFDLSSTGATWQHLSQFRELDVMVAYYSNVFFYTKEKPVLPEKFSYILNNKEHGQTNEMLEVMNCANHGYIKSVEMFDENLMTAEFYTPELPARLIKEIHSSVILAQQLAPHYKAWVREELGSMSNEDLKTVMALLGESMCKRTDLLLSVQNYISAHNQEYLESM